MASVRHILFGRPFPSSRAHHERLDNVRGLAVFASDTISSNAYASEAIMTTLVLISAVSLTLPITLGIALLVLVVVLSYNQTIIHYPMGGGAYRVAKDNLGTTASLIAAAALLGDYVLTVAVSVAAGVKALASAFPEVPYFHEHRVYIGVALIVLLTWANMRGVRESSSIFAIPTYAFVGTVLLVIGIGLVRKFELFGAPALPSAQIAEAPISLSGMTAWVVLRSFAAGCTALTGIEAVSNGVQAFRQPAPKNAVRVMRSMGILAMLLFIGIGFLATHTSIDLERTHTESVLSQLTRTIAGTGPLYYAVQACTMLILVLAANTAYQDFPRLSAIIANDGFLPRWMAKVGSRLVYSTGIGMLALLSSLILIAFNGDEIRLLPLYAIGVFTSFTLSQAGMVRLWNKISRLKPSEEYSTGETTLHYEPNWRWKSLPSLIGCIVTGIVLIVLAATKFTHGAWIILIAIPLMVAAFIAIKRHYDHVAHNLRLSGLNPSDLRDPADVVVVPVGDVHRASLRAIKFACRFSNDVRVLTVVENAEQEAAVRKRWNQWSGVVPNAHLQVLYTDFRDFMGPLVAYVDFVTNKEFPGQLVPVVIPEFVPDRKAANILHNQTATLMRLQLRGLEDVVIIDVPYHLRRQGLSHA